MISSLIWLLLLQNTCSFFTKAEIFKKHLSLTDFDLVKQLLLDYFIQDENKEKSATNLASEHADKDLEAIARNEALIASPFQPDLPDKEALYGQKIRKYFQESLNSGKSYVYFASDHSNSNGINNNDKIDNNIDADINKTVFYGALLVVNRNRFAVLPSNFLKGFNTSEQCLSTIRSHQKLFASTAHNSAGDGDYSDGKTRQFLAPSIGLLRGEQDRYLILVNFPLAWKFANEVVNLENHIDYFEDTFKQLLCNQYRQMGAHILGMFMEQVAANLLMQYGFRNITCDNGLRALCTDGIARETGISPAAEAEDDPDDWYADKCLLIRRVTATDCMTK